MIDSLITIDKDYVLEKLKSLIKLCQETDISSADQPFGGRILAAQQMFDRTEQQYGHNDHFDLSDVMRQANRLWKIMNKINDGDDDAVDRILLDEQVEDFLTNGQKINAIKHYKTTMKTMYDEELSLRECKEYIDLLHAGLVRRGIIN